MKRLFFAAIAIAALAGPAQAQTAAPAAAPTPPRAPISTTLVEGTDNVYIFRNGFHQSIFVVTRDGVIATDPVAYGRPTGGQAYLDAIRKVTDKPLKYVVYSHHHFDHIAGGQALKAAGATFVAHHRAKARLEALKDPHTVLPDEAVGDQGRTITLGGTTLELSYHGLNHSDSTLVMRLPKEKLLFVVDTIPVGTVPGRGMIDFHPLEAEGFMRGVLALDWDRLIPGHPGPGDRLGTKKDVEDQLRLLQTASAEMKKLAQDGKCWDQAEKDFALPGFEAWPGYAAGLPFIARRYCGLWGRGT
ncbi:MBL fold metallo-hydrolase [Rubrivivax sp. A210]|uniref:MBL fold metallo-hydrolase n=1 Tax=Rubrivivax sp. A210 TaxID=2772301 RepID=UPI00191B4D10|nr:MBL fold metallo-hydrolase [Rubrivivax sp. A210]CAD5372200.1 MBL fold metallo-hydrolase [Rubrivivax sp. A210]